jgi:urease gamma subunit
VNLEELLLAVGKHLQQARLDRKWKVTDVEHAGGPSYKTVQVIEDGQAGHIESLDKCARALDLSIVDVIYSQLAALTPADLDLAHGRLRLPARHKGTGRPALWIALTRQAVEAFTAFDDAHLYGSFSNSSLRKSFKVAAKKAGLGRAVRPYDLRHSFATAALRATASTEAVAQLMQHGSAVTTRRYVMEAEAQVAAAHGAVVVEHFDRTVGQIDGAPPSGGGAVGLPVGAPPGITSGITSTANQRNLAQSSARGITQTPVAGPRLVRTKRRSD